MAAVAALGFRPIPSAAADKAATRFPPCRDLVSTKAASHLAILMPRNPTVTRPRTLR